MALTDWLSADLVTAIGVGFGALLGGLSALIKEMRNHSEQNALAAGEPTATRAMIPDTLEEEFQHLSRTIWIVEKRLSDRLQRIEARLGAKNQTGGDDD